MRPLLIGQAPGPTSDPDFPLFPMPVRSAGQRLCKLTGLSTNDYLRTFDRVNLLYRFPGKHKNEDMFPKAQARIAADAIRPLCAGRPVVCVGRQVGDAFGLKGLDFCTWQPVHCGRGPAWPRSPALFAIIPHTSGQNRFYNEPENVARVQQFLRGLLMEWGLPSAADQGSEGSSAGAGSSAQNA